jgi:TonB-linked SusC/RagA family outer membrane protein
MRKVFYLMVALSLVLFGNSWAQERTVSGTVTSSEDGSGLPGVNVILKGTTTGTVTDVNGAFKLTVPAEGGTLVFSFIGLKTFEAQIGNRSVVDVPMASDVTQLSEVVVTALNIPREKKTLGYATQEVKSENLRVARDENVVNSLAGKVSGVQVIGGSGAKFGQAAVRIRGVRGLTASEPLYVVDGIVITDPSAVNMDNVESVNVLKGASAAALYGNRARDGVIVITSKKGQEGQLTIDWNTTIQMENVRTLPEYQDIYGGGYSETFKTFTYNPAIHDPALAGLDGMPYPNPMYADESWGAKMEGQMVAQWDAWTPGHPNYGKARPWSSHPDNWKDFFNTGWTSNNSIQVGKASEDYNVRAAFSQSRRTGVLPGSEQNKNFLNLNTSINLAKNVQLFSAINYSKIASDGNLTEGYNQIGATMRQWHQRQIDMDLLRSSYRLPNGTYTSWNILSPENPSPLYWDNPFTDMYANPQNRTSENVFLKFGASWEIVEGLKAQLSFLRATRNDLYEAITGSGTLNVDRYQSQSDYRVEDNIEFIVSYNKHFNDDWSLSALVGANNRQDERFYLNGATAGGLSVPELYNLKASIDRPIAENYKSFKEIRSVFAQASLGFRDMVYLDATVRTDWSSTLPLDNNSYTYPSVSGTFIFSELLSNQNTLSFGKLRASYAQVGGDVDPYQLAPSYAVGTPYGNVASMAVPNTLPNANLKPQTSESIEAGIELGFLQNRIKLDFAYFTYNNKDEIIQVSTPATSGVTAAYVNSGLTVTNGYEVTLGGTPVRTTDFNWDVSFNIASYRNEVRELYPGLNTIQLANGQNGTSTSGGWGGLSAQARVPDPVTGETYEWGTLIGTAYKRDANGNIIVDADGYAETVRDQVLGTILPDFTGGIFNRFTYKNFDLSFTIDWQTGGTFSSWSKMFQNATGIGIESVALNDKGVQQREDPANGGGLRFEGAVFEDGTANDVYLGANDFWWSQFALHERWLYSSDYVKLREFRLGYTFPSSVLGDKIRSLNIAFVGNNPLMIWSAVKDIDASELSGDSVRARANGAYLEGGQMPPTRSFGLDLKIGF